MLNFIFLIRGTVSRKCVLQSECEKLLIELLSGVRVQIEAISSSKSAHDCMFSPQAVLNTLCQDYILLVGHLTRSKIGCNLLDKLGVFNV